jgi:hypothetical protein
MKFFREVFRKKLFESFAALQKDLDAWLDYYNNRGPIRGMETWAGILWTP